MINKCVIITGFIEGFGDWISELAKDAFVMCADAGYRFAKEKSIKVDLLIGDFDSYEDDIPDEKNLEIIKVNVIKDDTDTGLCVKEAIKRGFNEINLIGGVGGRLSHTLANLQTMAFASENVKKISLVDGERKIFLLNGPVSIRVPKTIENTANESKYLSLFAHGGEARGIDITGVFYPLEGATLDCNFPLGCSNVITEDFATISLKEGKLIVIIE